MEGDDKTIEIGSLEHLQTLKTAIVIFKGKIGKELELVEGLVRKAISQYESKLNEAYKENENEAKKLSEGKNKAKTAQTKEENSELKGLEGQRKAAAELQKQEEAINKMRQQNKESGNSFESFKNSYLKPYNRELLTLKEKIAGQSNDSVRLLEELMFKVTSYLDVNFISENHSSGKVQGEMNAKDKKNEYPSGGFSGGGPVLNYTKKFMVGFAPHYFENRMMDGKDVIALFKSNNQNSAIGALQINKENGQHGYLLDFVLPKSPSFSPDTNDYSKAFVQMELAAKENGVKELESSVSKDQEAFYKSAGYEIDTSGSMDNANKKTESVIVVRKKII